MGEISTVNNWLELLGWLMVQEKCKVRGETKDVEGDQPGRRKQPTFIHKF